MPKPDAKRQQGGLGKHARLIMLALWVLAVAALSFSYAWQRCQVLAYNPVNGDFQNYNVFRRMLAGQTPYVDFANYVGMAPVLLNLPFLLLRGDFAASLFVTNFTCNVLFSLLVFCVFWLVTQHTPTSLLVSAVFSKLVSSGLLGLLPGGAGRYLQTLFTNLYTPSNSMRIARMFWPVLLVLVFLLFDWFYHRKTGSHYALPTALQSRLFCTVLGLVCGLGLTWSNDFGLAVIFCTAVLVVLLLARQSLGTRAFAARLGLFLAALAAGGLLSALLATGGQPGAWLRFTLGVGQTQYSYFNGTGGQAVLPYIFTNPRLLLYTAAYVIFLLVCLWRLWRKTLSNRLLLAGFGALVVLAASYAYIISGSGYNFTEALEGCFWLAAAAFAAKGVLHLLHRRRRAAQPDGSPAADMAPPTPGRHPVGAVCVALLCAAAVLFSALALRDATAEYPAPAQGVYVAALGGVATYPLALADAAALTAGSEVFSVYATGLEVAKDQFQPSGYDYIIHALGEEAQAAYLEAFLAGDYAYVQTMNLGLESWLCVQNWYFYRQVAARYVRTMATEYTWVWARSQASQVLDVAAHIETTQTGNTWHITVTCPDAPDGVADVAIAYQMRFASPWGAAFSLGRMTAGLTVPDPLSTGGQTGCWLPAQSETLHIPIALQNGSGTAILYPGDAGACEITLTSATVNQVLPSFVPA